MSWDIIFLIHAVKFPPYHKKSLIKICDESLYDSHQKRNLCPNIVQVFDRFKDDTNPDFESKNEVKILYHKTHKMSLLYWV